MSTVENPNKHQNLGGGENDNNNDSSTGAAQSKDYDKPYIAKSSVTITLVKSSSKYREANAKVLNNRIDYIGSSITSSRLLSSNGDEIAAYFPKILGLAANHQDFVTRVKQYLNNIQIKVNELGKTFDTSFYFHKKADYINWQNEFDKIEDEYKRAAKEDIGVRVKALNIKINKLNMLESTKHAYGYPMNVEDYLMYRHCLLYPDIAKDSAIVSTNKSIRFYFRDEQKEEQRAKKLRAEVNKAKSNYVKAVSSPKLFNAVYVQYCVLKDIPINYGMAETDVEKENKLDKFSSDEPIKFNKIFMNKDLEMVSNIELFVSKGLLYKSEVNQNVTDINGNLIGANMKEVCSYFTDPVNAQTYQALVKQINL